MEKPFGSLSPENIALGKANFGLEEMLEVD